jgi:hypothetical protein
MNDENIWYPNFGVLQDGTGKKLVPLKTIGVIRHNAFDGEFENAKLLIKKSSKLRYNVKEFGNQIIIEFWKPGKREI